METIENLKITPEIDKILGDKCFPIDIFINQKQIKKFICNIDNRVFREPILDDCGHTFGKKCFQNWISNKKDSQQSQICPSSQNELKTYEIKSNITVADFMDDLEIRCLNYQDGCEWEGVLNELEEHLQQQCQYVDIECVNEKCNSIIKRKDLDKHLNEDCPFQKIACKLEVFGCNSKIERQNMTIHLIEQHQEHIIQILEKEKEQQENDQALTMIQKQEIEKLKVENQGLKDQYEEMFNQLSNEKQMVELEKVTLLENQQKLESQIVEQQEKTKKLQQEINELQEKIKRQEEECKKKSESSIFDNTSFSNIKSSLFEYNNNAQNKTPQDSQNQESPNNMENAVPAAPPPELTSFEKYQEALNRRIKEQLDREQKYVPIQQQQSVNLQQNNNYQQNNLPLISQVTPIGQSLPQPRHNQAQQYQMHYQQQDQFMDLYGHSNTITSLISLSRINNHDLIVSVSEDRMLRVWDLGTLQCVQILSGHTSAITGVCFIENKHLLMTVSQDCTLRIWEMKTGQCKKIVRSKCPLTTIIFFKMHQVAVVGGEDRKLRVISPDDNNFREELCSLEQEVTCISSNFAMKENQIVAGDKNGKLYLIEPDFEQKRSRIIGLFASKIAKERKGHDFSVICVQMAKKIRMILSCAFEEQYLKVWSENLELIREIKLCELRNQINCMQFEERTCQIIIGTSDEQLIVLNTDFNVIKQFKKEALGINSVCINPETNTLVYAGNFYDSRINKLNYVVRIRKSIL